MPSPHLFFPGERLSEAELTAACLDGHLVALGEAFIPADAVETPALRAASLRPLLGDVLAATHLSAAWVHGALAFPPARHRAQRASALRLHHVIDRRIEYHDRRVEPDDLQRIGGVWVTRPARTVADLARAGGAVHEHAVRMLAAGGVADAADGVAWLLAAGALPHKRAALALLRRLTTASAQPDVTR